MTNDLDSLIRSAAALSDEDAVRPVRDETRRALLAQITAAAVASPRPRRRWRWSFGLPLVVAGACATAAAVVVLPGAPIGKAPGGDPSTSVGPGTFTANPVAALSFTRREDYIEVKIKDPVADPARYRREFAAHGLRIRLSLVPASPSVAGHVVMSEGEEIKPIHSDHCYSMGGGDTCAIGLRVPIGFKGEAAIVIGRAARPGEPYASTNSAFTPGEALHCLDIRGLPLDAALAKISTRKVKAAVFNHDTGLSYGRDKLPPGPWYATDAVPWAPGELMLFVSKARPTGNRESGLFFRDCPR
jgi:hypothetical protein